MLLKLSRIDVLVLDDFAMAPMKDTQRRDFLEICDDRYQSRSMVLTSQVPTEHWHEQIGDPTLPTASSTVWCITHIGLHSTANRCARAGRKTASRITRAEGFSSVERGKGTQRRPLPRTPIPAQNPQKPSRH